MKRFLLLLSVCLLCACTSSDPAPTEVVKFPLVVATSATETATATQTITPTVSPSVTPTFLPSTPTPTIPSTNTASVTPSTSEVLTGCAPPSGWVTHQVQAGETLFAYQLGAENAVGVDEIIAANCLTERWIYEGQLIFLPLGAAENAPSSDVLPTAFPTDPNAPPPPQGLTRTPHCPCEITIRVGWRLEQIAEVIDSLPVGFYGRDFLAAARANFPLRDFMNGMPSGASLEGYFPSGTYTLTNEMTASAFRDMLLDAFAANLGVLALEAPNVGLTPYQAVTLASIIVKEGSSPEEQPLVSSVFHNRLKGGKGLGATVTTQYAVGRAGDWWPNVAGIISTYDSPYNTNLYVGLPPTPIANVTVNALTAAVRPAQTNYLFFTAKCDGDGNAFAETYEQHLANVNC